jgi:hypothetical protein
VNLKALQEILAMAEIVRQIVAVIEATANRIATNPDDITADELAVLAAKRREVLDRLVKLAD